MQRANSTQFIGPAQGAGDLLLPCAHAQVPRRQMPGERDGHAVQRARHALSPMQAEMRSAMPLLPGRRRHRLARVSGSASAHDRERLAQPRREGSRDPRLCAASPPGADPWILWRGCATMTAAQGQGSCPAHGGSSGLRTGEGCRRSGQPCSGGRTSGVCACAGSGIPPRCPRCAMSARELQGSVYPAHMALQRPTFHVQRSVGCATAPAPSIPWWGSACWLLLPPGHSSLPGKRMLPTDQPAVSPWGARAVTGQPGGLPPRLALPVPTALAR